MARGLSNHTWTYPEIAGQLIPKLMRIVGIFLIIWWIDWRIALAFLVSFFVILGFSLKDLVRLIKKGAGAGSLYRKHRKPHVGDYLQH